MSRTLSWCALNVNASLGQACWCGNMTNGGMIIRSMSPATQLPPRFRPMPQPSSSSPPSPLPTDNENNSSTDRSQQPKQTVRGGAEPSGCVEGLGDCGTFASNVVEERRALGAHTTDELVDDFCSSMGDVTKSSPASFRSIKGERDNDGDWTSRVSLQGFRRCYIQKADRNDGESFYCNTPESSFSMLDRKISACLSNANSHSRTDNHGRRHDRFEIDGTRTALSLWESSSGGVSLSVSESQD